MFRTKPAVDHVTQHGQEPPETAQIRNAFAFELIFGHITLEKKISYCCQVFWDPHIQFCNSLWGCGSQLRSVGSF